MVPPRLPSRQCFFVVLALAVAVQLFQGVLTQRTLAPYARSYWLVTYQEGFTRRGLAGETIRRVTGSIATVTEIELLQWLLTLSVVVAVGVLLIAALRRADSNLDLAAIALGCSPFVFDFVIRQRRPDHVGFAIVIVYGLVLLRFPERATVAAVFAGIALALAVAVQDSVFLQCLPWIATITILRAASREQAPTVPLAAACLPGTAVAAASVFLGRLDPDQVSTLKQVASAKYPWLSSGSNVFEFLADDLGASFDRVKHLGIGDTMTILVCGLLFALQGALMLGLRAPRLRPLLSARRFGGPLLLVSIFGSIVALVALLVLGIDWARWFGSFGLMATVSATLALLYRPTPAHRAARPPLLALTLVASYLLWLAPLPDKFGLRGGLRFLTMVPH